MKVWVLMLVLANLLLAVVNVASEPRAPPPAPSTDLNADKLRVVALPPEPVAPLGK